MSSILGKYLDEFEDVYYCEKNNNNDIYAGYNIKEKREVSLKIIKKEQFNDYNLLIEKLNKEKEILNLCKSENILNFYRFFENEKYVILEQDWYESNLHEYIFNNGPSYNNKDFFKKAVLGFASALKILYEKKIMHRFIRANNVFLVEKKDIITIKLGEFSKAIFIKDNISEPIDSILYSAPEIINGEKYDERCDLWSFGITLYELYFGELPYGFKPKKNMVIKAVNDEKNFHTKKTNIPSLDILFDGLLKINPEHRMTYKELFNLIFDKKFMDNNEDIKIKDKEIIIAESFKNDITVSPSFSSNVDNSHNSNMNKSYIDNEPINIDSNIINEERYNNILYYDENKTHIKSVYKDSNLFDKNTNGAFILCTNMDCFQIILDEILRENEKDNNIIFNIISTGSAFDKLINFILNDNKFGKCFNNICIYCIDIKKYENFKINYKNKIKDNIYNHREDVINFIKNTSSNKIKKFKLNKLITLNNCEKIYKDKYYRLFKCINKQNDINYKRYFEEIKILINEMEKKNKLKTDKNELIKILKVFDINNNSSELILTKFLNIIYQDLNYFLTNSDIKNKDSIFYFSDTIIYSLINYNKILNIYYTSNKTEYYYMEINLSLSELLQYERVKTLITFPNFCIFYKNKNVINRSITKNDSRFSVLFILNFNETTNIYHTFNIQNFLSRKEEAILILPFTFFKLIKFEFDFKNFQADIYLETK